MRALILALGLLLPAALLAGCSVSFDPDGQPCDSQRRCLAGYACDSTNHCRAGDAGHPSTATGSGSGSIGSGSGSGSSGTHGSSSTTATVGTGTTGTTATTTSGTTTGSTGTTGATTCAELVCPAAQECSMATGVASCVARSTQGATCTSQLACGSGVCITPPGVAEGLCVNSCDAGPCSPGQACTNLLGDRGNSFWACIDTPSPTVCSGGATCGSGLSCLPFDVPIAQHTGVGAELPVLFCDTPLPGGLPANSACTRSDSCASGLCANNGMGSGTCLDTCRNSSGCLSTESCTAVTSIENTRNELACVSGTTTCQLSCSSCGPDAYSCENTLAVCTLPCGTGDDQECGPSRTCLVNTFGNYCSVTGSSPCPP